MKALKLGLSLTLLALCGPTGAAASQSATIGAALRPERLGKRATIFFSFRITAYEQLVPSPLLTVSLYYPANIGLVTSGLGLETCTPHQLETQGRCPPNSLMGYGRGVVEIPVGPEIIQEQGQVTTWMAPVQNGHLALLFYADGGTPVSAELIFTAQLLEAPTPYGGQLATNIPLIPGLPEGPDASVVQMTSTIGPMNVTYYARFRGRRVAYHPNGLLLPQTCPRAGFPFAATFTFLDGTHTRATTRVPCPRAG